MHVSVLGQREKRETAIDAKYLATVAGSFLYIDGGDFSFINNGTAQNEYGKVLVTKCLILLIILKRQLCSQSISHRIGPTQQSLSAQSTSLQEYLYSTKGQSYITKTKIFSIRGIQDNHRNSTALHSLPSQYGRSSQTGLEVERGTRCLDPSQQT